MPIPALIGAGAAIIGSGIQAYGNYKAKEEERKARERAAKELKAAGQLTDDEYRQVLSNIDSYYQNRGSLGSEADVNAYKQAIANYDPEDYAAEVGEFGYDKTKEDFLNPYYGAIISDTADQIQHTAAGAGLGRGTGAALNIAKGTAEKSDELYRTAMQEMNQDRSFAYQKFQDAIQNNQNRLNAINQATMNKMNLQGNLAQDYFNTMDQAQADKIAANQDRLNAQTAYATAMAGLY
jgi:hypothetical protein